MRAVHRGAVRQRMLALSLRAAAADAPNWGAFPGFMAAMPEALVHNIVAIPVV
jgi:hypothetical protein